MRLTLDVTPPVFTQPVFTPPFIAIPSVAAPVVAFAVALGVALAVLLACPPVQAVELIDLHAIAPPPAQSAGHALAPPPAYFSPPYSSPAEFHFPPYPAAQYSSYLPVDAWAGMAFATTLSDPPPATGAAPPMAMSATPIAVPEPISVLMLACGLLLMVPGAWAARWSRLGDSESLLQRRFP